MSEAFDYFVVFAEMRTGSNLLESYLNSFAGITCHGEAFNPHFIGYPNQEEALGYTKEKRDQDPLGFLASLKEEPGVLGGFRYFNDHDPRVVAACLEDPRCAKIILTRNPLESYVSLGIARATGQWKLTNVKRRKEAQAVFDASEFEQHVDRLQSFQLQILKGLQETGQTAFYLSYEDLQDLEVINGLAKFLGIEQRLEKLEVPLKKQNPSSLSDKVANPDDMERALGKFDFFGLNRTPNFEPRRGAAVPSMITAARAPLLYMPVRSGLEGQICNWLAALDGVDVDALQTGLTQKELRQWKVRHAGHRSFAALRHPVARAHSVFCTRILATGPESFGLIRKTLRNFYKLPIPGRVPHEDYDPGAHREAFKAFLKFLKANLAAQTHVRVDSHWATQAAILQGMANFAFPHRVYREEELETELPALSKAAGYDCQAFDLSPQPDVPFELSEIYDAEIEALAHSVYQRDYVMFGFDRWA